MSITHFMYAQDTTAMYIVKDATTLAPIADCSIWYYSGRNNRHIITSGDGIFYISGTYNIKLSLSHLTYEPLNINLSELKGNVILLKQKNMQLNALTVYSSYNTSNKGNLYKFNSMQASQSISEHFSYWRTRYFKTHF